MKRVVTIQDLSCLGKCSLTTALPIISAAGVETTVLPTALLSVHTAFDSFTFLDLTVEMEKITENWKKHDFTFDGIYTGYLGSVTQLDSASRFIDSFKTKTTKIIVDPVMGDNSRLYTGISPDFPNAVKKLCKKADIIVPNLTEAAFLTDTKYLDEYCKSDIKDLLLKLANLGAKTSVLTGIKDEHGRFGIMAYNSENDSFFEFYAKKASGSFHGTGDIFASALTGAVMRGINVEKALEIAVLLCVRSIELTLADKNAVSYGVNFEEALPFYCKSIENEILSC